MGLFGGTKEEPRQSRAGRVLKASGLRIQAGGRDTIQALAQTRQSWQSDAWGYRDDIGELRFAVQYRSRAVSRVKYMVAQVMPGEDEPIPLDSEKGVKIPAALAKAAEFELNRLPLNAGYRFLGVADENLGITGEVWLHGYKVDGEERWEALSVDEVHAGVDGVMYIREFGTAKMAAVDPNKEEMLRLWVPHPRFKILADSPMRSLMSVCEELVLNGREMRAASRSRFAANGILLVPEGLTLLNALKDDSNLLQDSSFMADLAATLLAPIMNEGDPGAVIPAVISGNIEDLKEIRHFRMDRETSSDLIAKIDKGLSRLGAGLDIPPEIITGMSDSNHWTAWQIDASTYRHHIDPAVRTLADSLTEGFLWPALLARGFTLDQVKTVQVWYDAGVITENPNRVQDAKDAYDRGAIGFEPLRQALGFNAADAPTDEEVLRMVSVRMGIDPQTSGQLLQILFGREPIEAVTRRVVDPAKGESIPTETPAQIGPGQAQPGAADRATPSTPPPGLSAGARSIMALISAAPPTVDEGDWLVVDGRKLMEVDRVTRDRLVSAADAAMTRALEKAGAKIRSKAQKDKALVASIADLDTFAVAHAVGRQQCLAMGLTEQSLLAEAFDGLEGKFTRWVEASIEQTIKIVLAMLRVKPESKRGQRITKRLRTGMSARTGSGWSLFRDRLFKLAERYLFSPVHVDDDGELVPDLIVPPGLVRGVLAHVGGTHADTGGVDDEGTAVHSGRPVGGIGLGEEVAIVLTDEGAETLGYEWIYGITPVTRHFEPHFKLDGERFTGWTDPKLVPIEKFAWVGPHYTPGDHNGCMCDYMPTYALREYAEVEAENAIETENARNDRILAESDDRAGRKGTTAQLQRDERERILKLRERYIKEGQTAR